MNTKGTTMEPLGKFKDLDGWHSCEHATLRVNDMEIVNK